MIIATAGHVDHGKTSLLRALTGIDADRLPEEKKRGMTIDLGYAYLSLTDGRTLGFIDVPGHERFLSNMLAGVGGVRHALLVVAADDGIMPQTREHLAILQLLGMHSITVAISKADLVDGEHLAQLEADLQAELARYALPASACFAVSSFSGQGVPALREHLQQLASQPAKLQRFRLSIDRAFTLSGAGLVVTGTALGGEVKLGDMLWLTGKNCVMRVRGLHVQNQAAESGQAGQRIALNLVGEAGKADIRRGDWLLQQAPPALGTRISIQLQLSPTLAGKVHHWQAVHIHHAASHSTGHLVLLSKSELSAGESTVAELSLDQPLYLAEGDRLILRDASARQTLGAASVLELQPPTRAKRQPERLHYLQALATLSDAAASLRWRAQRQAVHLPAFAWAQQLLAEPLAVLTAECELIVAGEFAYLPAQWQRLKQQVLERLSLLHQQQPDQLGASRGRLQRLALPTESEAAVARLLDELLAAGLLVNSRGWLHLPEHVLAFAPDEQALWQRLQVFFQDSMQPQWVRELAGGLAASEDEVRAVLRKAVRLGHVQAVVPDRYYSHHAVQAMAAMVRELCQQQGYAEVAAFRNQMACGRKLAVQILEYFDRSGFTRRLGDKHFIRDGQLFS
ncbi:selenocysteine-specific translation elongation factor [Neisseriaceae bacterium TC5R-5]|nr:selenocysteine-specific translation elongation factor [Neisseriaceae bacterium TC5R-5]